ncbi:MAG: hypothetical protein ACE5FT_04095 [Candidatus Nanoarchaeia archaeon]
MFNVKSLDETINDLQQSIDADVQLFTTFVNAVEIGSSYNETKALYDEQRTSLKEVGDGYGKALVLARKELALANDATVKEPLVSNPGPVMQSMAHVKMLYAEQRNSLVGVQLLLAQQMFQKQNEKVGYIVNQMNHIYNHNRERLEGLQALTETMHTIAPIRLSYIDMDFKNT